MNERTMEIDQLDMGLLVSTLGYRKGTALPETLQTRVQELLQQVPKTVRSITRMAPIRECTDKQVSTELGLVSSPTFAGLATEADSVVYGLVTAGPEMDGLINGCEDTVDALIFDACGSALVEQGVNELLQKLRKETGKNVSLPFSPGYCDYPLTEQERLFNVFEKNVCGIAYHPASFMMSPIKTISFVAAAGPSPLNTNPCSICAFDECQNRR